MEQNNKEKESIDVSGALKEVKSGVKFQGRQYSPYPFQPKIIQWIIKYSGGLIKNPKQAAYFLLGFIVLAIVISLFLFFGGEKAEIKALPGQRIIYPPDEPPRLQQPVK